MFSFQVKKLPTTKKKACANLTIRFQIPLGRRKVTREGRWGVHCPFYLSLREKFCSLALSVSLKIATWLPKESILCSCQVCSQLDYTWIIGRGRLDRLSLLLLSLSLPGFTSNRFNNLFYRSFACFMYFSRTNNINNNKKIATIYLKRRKKKIIGRW